MTDVVGGRALAGFFTVSLPPENTKDDEPVVHRDCTGVSAPWAGKTEIGEREEKGKATRWEKDISDISKPSKRERVLKSSREQQLKRERERGKREEIKGRYDCCSQESGRTLFFWWLTPDWKEGMRLPLHSRQLLFLFSLSGRRLLIFTWSLTPCVILLLLVRDVYLLPPTWTRRKNLSDQIYVNATDRNINYLLLFWALKKAEGGISLPEINQNKFEYYETFEKPGALNFLNVLSSIEPADYILFWSKNPEGNVVVDPNAHKPKRKESNHNITVIKK